MSHDKYHAEPYFKFWRLTALENYGATDVRIDGVGLYGRVGGPELSQFAVGAEYSGGFAPGDLNAPVANLPSVTIEFLYPIAARHMDLQYAPVITSYTLSPTWNLQSTGSGARHSVCYSPELNLYVMTGAGTLMTSPDGEVWTSRTVAANQWREVCWSPELGIFMAVASNGVGRCITSSDGVTWTPRTILANSWQSVCWSPELGMFVATATSAGSNNIARSTNGTSWSYVDHALLANWRAVCWSPELMRFCIVGNATGSRSATSADGINWTSSSSINTSTTWLSVCWSGHVGAFVAVGSGLGTWAKKSRSVDGVTWVDIGSESAEYFDVIWAEGMLSFFAVVNDFAQISPDGITWVNAPAYPINGWRAAVWNDEQAEMCVVGFPTGTNTAMLNAGVPGSTLDTDAPRTVRVDVSNDNREFFELETLRDLQW
jgi:hypothetical protein